MSTQLILLFHPPTGLVKRRTKYHEKMTKLDIRFSNKLVVTSFIELVIFNYYNLQK
jgi:hypothetical protein